MQRWLVLLFVGIFCPAIHASALDTIGVTLLRTVTTNLNGAGVRVAQPEAVAPAFEVNPASVSVGQPAGLFTYASAAGTANTFPNAVGSESGHADGVAANFYGLPGGVATNVLHVDNYDADFFYNIISAAAPTNVNDPVVNQSFIFCNLDFSHLSVSREKQINSQFDNYATRFNTLFISGAGNGGPTNQAIIYPPASCYNGLGVAAFGGGSCIGPTLDNGRCKPDITAPAGETSFSTPYVAGAAAILLQAGLRGDSGNDTNAAADMRSIKCLLLNGAVKPAGWTNSNSSPLDARYGAGVVNVFNSYEQLADGKHIVNFSTNIPVNTAHPPVTIPSSINSLSGWDLETITNSSTSKDAVNHYFFNVTNAANNAAFMATATIVWNRQVNQTAINNLNLYLYNCANSNLVACSTSLVDNVEHIFVPQLPHDRYDLQILKKGGTVVTNREIYALAFEFSAPSLAIARSGINVMISWPIFPDNFLVESTASLNAPALWNTNGIPASVVTNNQNCIWISPSNQNQFFRLREPDF